MAFLFTALGYLCGSVLFADIFTALFHKKGACLQSEDRNPGTANAYLYGGFWCGTLTLIGDLLKGFLPVFLYLRLAALSPQWGLAPVLAAPVLGHIFSLFHRFRGGKGVATSFGCLLGLLPYFQPVAILAGVFLMLSLVLRVSPHFYRTLVAFPLTVLLMAVFRVAWPVWAGFAGIAGAVCLKLLFSKEKRRKCEVKLLWMR